MGTGYGTVFETVNLIPRLPSRMLWLVESWLFVSRFRKRMTASGSSFNLLLIPQGLKNKEMT